MIMKPFQKTILLFFLVIISGCDNDDSNCCVPEYPTPELEDIKIIGGSGIENARSIIATNDGGFAVFGSTSSMDGDITDKTTSAVDFWLLKFDISGNLQWNKTYGGSGEDLGQHLIQTQDGGYALIGYGQSDDGDASNNEGFHDQWIVKTDASGNIEWEKSYGYPGHDHAYGAVQTADGGFFISGFLDISMAGDDPSYGKGTAKHGVGEFWGAKLQENGELEWRRYYGGTNNDRAHSVVQANDGGFVMAGFSESDDYDISDSKGSYDYWVVKVGADKELKWEKSFGGSGIEISECITKTSDNGYILAGHTFSDDKNVTENKGNSDFWIVKIDENGNLMGEKTLGGSDFDAATSIKESADGGFLIVGNSRSNDKDVSINNGENDIWVVKTDINRNLLWEMSVGGSKMDFGFDLLETMNGDIWVVGETESDDFDIPENKGGKDLVLFKLKLTL